MKWRKKRRLERLARARDRDRFLERWQEFQAMIRTELIRDLEDYGRNRHGRGSSLLSESDRDELDDWILERIHEHLRRPRELLRLLKACVDPTWEKLWAQTERKACDELWEEAAPRVAALREPRLHKLIRRYAC